MPKRTTRNAPPQDPGTGAPANDVPPPPPPEPEVPHHHHEAPKAPPPPKRPSWARRWATTVLGITVGTVVGFVVSRKLVEHFPSKAKRNEDEGEPDAPALGPGGMWPGGMTPGFGIFNAAPAAPAPVIINAGNDRAPRSRGMSVEEARAIVREDRERTNEARITAAMDLAEAEAVEADAEFAFRRGHP